MNIFTDKEIYMRTFILTALISISISSFSQVNKKDKDFYELRIYEYHSLDQQKVIDEFIGNGIEKNINTKLTSKTQSPADFCWMQYRIYYLNSSF